MNLKEYIAKRKLTKAEFSKLSGISRPAISNYIFGKRRPSAKICDKIQMITKNEVTFNDLMNYADKFGL